MATDNMVKIFITILVLRVGVDLELEVSSRQERSVNVCCATEVEGVVLRVKSNLRKQTTWEGKYPPRNLFGRLQGYSCDRWHDFSSSTLL